MIPRKVGDESQIANYFGLSFGCHGKYAQILLDDGTLISTEQLNQTTQLTSQFTIAG